MDKCYYCKFCDDDTCKVKSPTIIIERRLFRKDKICQVYTKVKPDGHCNNFEVY